MNTLTIDQAIYDGAALYARQNNISIQKVIEQGVQLLLANVRLSNTKRNEIDIEEALFKTLHDGGDCLINGDNTHCERQRFILIGLRIGKALDQCGRRCR